MQTILKCTDCPFNGQDNVYCRTCSIPIHEALRQLSDVCKIQVDGFVRYCLIPARVGFG